MTRVLVLFDSMHGATETLAHSLAAGIALHPGCVAVTRRIHASDSSAPEADDLTDPAELAAYDGIAFGSPVHFGNMSGAMRSFLDRTLTLWQNGSLGGKPATVFMAAGSGGGREAAILSFWNTLAIHGMVIVAPGIEGMEDVDKSIPQGPTPFGASTLASAPGATRPSPGELHIATLQGLALARVARALRRDKDGGDDEESLFATGGHPQTAMPTRIHPYGYRPSEAHPHAGPPDLLLLEHMHAKGIVLPDAPEPVGSYLPFRRTGDLVFINQIALEQGSVRHPGTVEVDVTDEQAKAAVRATMLNVIAVLRKACEGDLRRVAHCVQLTGFFATPPGYSAHASLLDEASRLAVDIWGENGKHARAAIGAASLPMRSSCEIQAVFELRT